MMVANAKLQLTALLVLMTGSGAVAGGICGEILAGRAPELGLEFGTLEGFKTCETGPKDGDLLVCKWEFSHAADGSRRVFEDLSALLMGCQELRNAGRDQGVSHPDFYDAIFYEFPRNTVSLSIKDKSTLGLTFVNLRMREKR